MAQADLYYIIKFGGRVLVCGTGRTVRGSHMLQLAEQHQPL